MEPERTNKLVNIGQDLNPQITNHCAALLKADLKQGREKEQKKGKKRKGNVGPRTAVLILPRGRNKCQIYIFSLLLT